MYRKIFHIQENHDDESATWIAVGDLMTGLMAIFLVFAFAATALEQESREQEQNVRLVLIQDISKITDELKKAGIDAEVNPKTGDISLINSDLLFAHNSAQLNERGKYFLNQFAPAYSQALFSLSANKYNQISRILIEGHSSSIGNASNNMTLSLNRANAVVQYIYNMPNFTYKPDLTYRLTPTGRGSIEATPGNEERDRKVIIRMRFVGDEYEADGNNSAAIKPFLQGRGNGDR